MRLETRGASEDAKPTLQTLTTLGGVHWGEVDGGGGVGQTLSKS